MAVHSATVNRSDASVIPCEGESSSPSWPALTNEFLWSSALNQFYVTITDNFPELRTLMQKASYKLTKQSSSQAVQESKTLCIPMDKLHFSKVGKPTGNVHGHWRQLVRSNIVGLKMDNLYSNWANKTSHVHLNLKYRQEIQPQTSAICHYRGQSIRWNTPEMLSQLNLNSISTLTGSCLGVCPRCC